jgi:hypothetical protein
MGGASQEAWADAGMRIAHAKDRLPGYVSSKNRTRKGSASAGLYRQVV